MTTKAIAITIYILGILFSTSASAILVNYDTICLGDSVPSGWIVVNREWNPTTCNYPYPPINFQGNVLTIAQYNVLPVGTILNVCRESPVPAGWTAGSVYTDIVSCASIYGTANPTDNMRNISHTSCVNQSQASCYPYQPTTVTASPMTVRIPYGENRGSVTVNYSSPGNPGACLWVQNSGKPIGLWGCAGSSASNLTWPYVPVGGSSTIWVSASSTSSSPRLATVTVHGVERPAPEFSASPQSVNIPAGQTRGSTTISWDTSESGFSTSCIWEQSTGGQVRLWGCVPSSGSEVWPFIPLGGNTTFWLTRDSQSATPALATLVVTGY